MEETANKIREQIADNSIILYMKGTPQMPQCGFSAKVVQILMACGHEFSFVDVLASPEIRATLPEVSNWPTFPQLYVEGELVGGCDIVTEMYEAEKLKPLLDKAMKKAG